MKNGIFLYLNSNYKQFQMKCDVLMYVRWPELCSKGNSTETKNKIDPSRTWGREGIEMEDWDRIRDFFVLLSQQKLRYCPVSPYKN
jgi:hypothetical protein